MNDLTTAVRAAGNNAEYDAAVKGILADKQVLAWILKGATTEYSAMSIERIIPLIDEPSVSKIAVNPGLTNAADSFITGMPQKSSIMNGSVKWSMKT